MKCCFTVCNIALKINSVPFGTEFIFVIRLGNRYNFPKGIVHFLSGAFAQESLFTSSVCSRKVLRWTPSIWLLRAQ